MFCDKLVRWSYVAARLTQDFWITAHDASGKERQRGLVILKAIRAWGYKRIQFAPCPWGWQVNDTFNVPTYYFQHVGNMLSIPMLATFAKQHSHAGCNVMDFLQEESQRNVERWLAGCHNLCLLPLTELRA